MSLPPGIPLAFIAISSGLLWGLLETVAVPKNDNDWPELHRWCREVFKIIFAASVVALMLKI
jgi:cytochrome bd-type quinol oxidase subunit 1